MARCQSGALDQLKTTKEFPMPEITINDIRSGIIIGLPLLEMIATRTDNKVDDALVVTLRVIATNDEIARAIEVAIAQQPELRKGLPQ